MTNDDFVAAVKAHLSSLPAREADQALADLQAILDEGVDPADLGSPEQYAAYLTEYQAEQPGPKVFGVPVELRGFTDPEVRARIWDPANPRIFVPHLAGAGWSINLGAVAVKLGWLRPDDFDADVLAAIPAPVINGVRAVPTCLAVVTVAASAVAATADSVPAKWTLTGKVKRWSSPRRTLLPLVGSAIATAWWGARPTKGPDQLVRPALAGGVNMAIAGAAVLTARAAHNPGKRQVAYPLLAVAPLVTQAALLLGPVRAGLHAIWKTVESS
jgi:hypothetical protein